MTEKDLKNHWFWKKGFKKHRIFENLENLNTSIFICAKVLYSFLFVIVVDHLFEIEYYYNHPMTYPEWSLFWTSILPNFSWNVFFIISCFITNTLSLIKTASIKIRIINFITFFLLFSALNSYPKINHHLHTALIPLFFLCFINFKPQKKYQNAVVFASAIGSILISYSLAGFWKILTGVKHLFIGDKGNFDLNAMTRYLKYNYSNKGEVPQFAIWLIEHEKIGFVLLWIGILAEFLAIATWFYPKVHRLWGVLLILMHIGIAISMQVNFAYMFVSIIPLLILSPFISDNTLNILAKSK